MSGEELNLKSEIELNNMRFMLKKMLARVETELNNISPAYTNKSQPAEQHINLFN